VAKETKNNLFNIEKEDKKYKKNKRRKKNTSNNKNKDEDKFSFDSEIIIGVTRVNDEQEEKTKKKKNSSNKNKKKENKEYKEKKKKNNKKLNDKKQSVKNKKKVKQQEEIISADEIEFRRENRKAKLQKKLRIMKCVILIAIIITIILLIMFSPLFNIKEILVENNEIVSKEQILSLSKIDINTNTFKLNKNKINMLIKENPYIEEVKIIRKLPSTVVLDIVERKPAYLIEYANGYVCIDKTGYILNISEQKQELPVLQGIETESDKFVVGNRLDVKDLNKIYVVSKIMDVASDIDMGNLITRVDIEKINSIKLILESKEKTVYIGNDTNLNIKLLTVQQILNKTEGLAGEIFVDMDLNFEYPIFRERV